MYSIGNWNFLHSNSRRSDKKGSKKKRGSGSDVDEMIYKPERQPSFEMRERPQM